MTKTHANTTTRNPIRLVVNNFRHDQASPEVADIEVLVTQAEYRLIKAIRLAEPKTAACAIAALTFYAEEHPAVPVDPAPYLYLVRPPVKKERKKTSPRIARGRTVQQALD
jgi:hypothetical protein